MEPDTATHASDPPENMENGSKDISEVLERLDVHDIQPDREIGQDNHSIASSGGAEDLSATSSTSGDVKDQDDNDNDGTWSDATKTNANSKSSKPSDKSDKKKSAFQVFKRFSSKGKKDKPESASLDKILRQVTIDSLPQKFVTKYLGNRPCGDLYGIQVVRQPLEDLVSALQDMPKGDDLPLINLKVSNSGLHISEHKANKSKQKSQHSGHIPIEFISYGVQDIRYTRIFTFILVKEMSYRKRLTECHAYLCDSVVTARKLALSVSRAFHDYAKTLDGKPFKFQVDLRSTKELEEELTSGGGSNLEEAEEEC